MPDLGCWTLSYRLSELLLHDRVIWKVIESLNSVAVQFLPLVIAVLRWRVLASGPPPGLDCDAAPPGPTGTPGVSFHHAPAAHPHGLRLIESVEPLGVPYWFRQFLTSFGV